MKKANRIIATIIGASMVATMATGCSIGKAKTESIDKTTIDSFTSITLDVNVAEIDIIPTSDEFAIEYTIHDQTIDYSVEDDELTINTESIKKIGFTHTEKSFIKIYVPENSEFVSLEYSGEVGDIRIKNLIFDEMDITTDVGNVILTDITVNNDLTIKTDVGNIDVTLANTDCSYEISADIANININDSNYTGFEISKNRDSDEGPEVSIKTDCGAIDFDY